MLAISLPDALAPYAILMGVGFLVGWYGHGARNNWLIAFGILTVLASVLLLQVAIASHDGRAPTGF